MRFTSSTPFATDSSPAANIAPNSVTSAPTMNTDLPEVTIDALDARVLRDRLGGGVEIPERGLAQLVDRFAGEIELEFDEAVAQRRGAESGS